jgi:hypothetical protein
MEHQPSGGVLHILFNLPLQQSFTGLFRLIIIGDALTIYRILCCLGVPSKFLEDGATSHLWMKIMGSV